MLTESDCTGGRAAMQFDTASQNNRLKYISNIDINKIQSALQSLKEERTHMRSIYKMRLQGRKNLIRN